MLLFALANSPRELAADQSHQSGGAGRHQVDHENEDHTIDRAGKPLENASAIFGTNSTNKPPNKVPAIEPTPADHEADEQTRSRGTKVKLSGATNWITMAPSAPATPV